MLCVVSGQTVVHWESSKASMTTLPRNWLSDIGWPNWFRSRKSGAGPEPSEVPRSRLGFAIAAESGPVACEPAGGPADGDPAPHPARPGSAPTAPSTARAHSARRARHLLIAFIAGPAYCGRAAPARPTPPVL